MDLELLAEVEREAAGAGRPEERAGRIAELVRERTGRRWVGIYRVTAATVENLAWSGPAAPAHPTFPRDQGLTGAAIRAVATVVANDVGNDARYLTNQETTGSELIAPVLVDGRPVGTLDVEEEIVGAFDERDRELFERVAAALAPLYA
jgi:L-methionine (R)-S-oxide reductase